MVFIIQMGSDSRENYRNIYQIQCTLEVVMQLWKEQYRKNNQDKNGVMLQDSISKNTWSPNFISDCFQVSDTKFIHFLQQVFNPSPGNPLSCKVQFNFIHENHNWLV